jgi:hypothetical protein
MRFCLLMFVSFLLSLTLSAQEERIVFLNGSQLYFQTLSMNDEKKIIDLSTIGKQKKKGYSIIKAEFDNADSCVVHCYLCSNLTDFGGQVLIVTFNIANNDLLCYQEYNIKSKITTTHNEKDFCVKRLPKYCFADYPFTNPVDNEVYVAWSFHGICKIPADSLTRMGYGFSPDNSIIYESFPEDDLSPIIFLRWQFIDIDRSPNNNFFLCDFLGEKKIFYCGKKGNAIDIYEYNIRTKIGEKIIAGGTKAKYSANSNLIIYEKAQQTWVFLSYKNCGYYIYNRERRESSFYKNCNDACFVRSASDYISLPPYNFIFN